LYETNYSVEDDELRLSLPVSKVDIERRTVHGFATLDNLDKQSDIVPLEASIKAFQNFRGNIREQHDPKKAVGRMISFKPESVYDEATNKVYSGVFVSAYVSRGAQDTWEKVLDGTLSGFSIGGKLNETHSVFDEDLDALVRIVDEYEMVELSLVDTPANPLANVTLVQKVGEVMEGMEIKGDLETVFVCRADHVVKVSKEELINCPVCHKQMHDVGYVESKDSEKAGIINDMVSTYMKPETVKEANSMAEQDDTTTEVEKTELVEETVEQPEVEKSEAVEEPAVTEPVEEVVKADEVEEAAEVDDKVSDLVIKALESMVDTLNALTEKVQGIEKSVAERMDSIETQVTKTSETVEEFGERVDKVEDTTAFRKSGDLGEVAQEKVQKTKSLWGGSFLTVSEL
jgi:hypothetical protein